MISEFLAPFEKNIVDFKESLPDRSIGKKITLYSKSITDLTNIDIALIGLNEYRGSVETNSNYLKINYLRKEFYSLYSGDWNINLVDLGDVRNATRPAMTIAAGLPAGPEDAEWRAIWRAVLAAGFELDRRRDVQGIYHRQVGLYTELLERGAAAAVGASIGGNGGGPRCGGGGDHRGGAGAVAGSARGLSALDRERRAHRVPAAEPRA